MGTKHCCPLISHVGTSLVLPCNSKQRETGKNTKRKQLDFISLSMTFIKGNPETRNPKAQVPTIKFPDTSMISVSANRSPPCRYVRLFFCRSFSEYFPFIFHEEKLPVAKFKDRKDSAQNLGRPPGYQFIKFYAVSLPQISVIWIRTEVL